MQNELMQWLASDLPEPVKCFQKQRECFAILRVSIAPAFDYAEYGPEEVTCITYAKKTIYTKT